MVRIPGGFDNVPLRDPQMFHQLPCGVRRSRWTHAKHLTGEPGDNVIKASVSPAAAQQFHQLFAKVLMVHLSIQYSVLTDGAIFGLSSC